MTLQQANTNGWTIQKLAWPESHAFGTYEYVHEDYDGAPDGSDKLFGHADSITDALEAIKEIEEEQGL